jgi:hypothetical protein
VGKKPDALITNKAGEKNTKIRLKIIKIIFTDFIINENVLAKL